MGKGTQRLHQWVPDTPVRMVNGEGRPVDLAELEHRLTGNRMAAAKEMRSQKRGWQR
jgi:hypothetical protein